VEGCNEFFKTLCFTLKILTYTVFVVVVVRIFFYTKQQVLKNSIHGQKSFNFDVVSLKILEKL
jgi:hypothetical protein